MIKKLLCIVIVCLFACSPLVTFGQTDIQALKNAQLSSSRVSEAWAKYNDSLSRDFKRKNMDYPPRDIYIRAFKSQNELELWARNNEASEYKLVKTMHICAISGILGPKRAEGDRQVPEGLYFIDEFNPKSEYHLSMLLNYPNFCDQAAGHGRLGGDIYIHGGCVTIGCMPMTNEGIQELYVVCLNARLNGQENIPVHVFPTRLNKSGMSYLSRQFPNDKVRQQFWADLKGHYEYFEKTHRLLPVMYAPDGRYVN
jgi:murein L,D-transpeptidase YafK